MLNLDGKEPVKVQTSFDPHGDRVKHPHTHSRHTGYEKVADAPAATAPGSHDDPKPATADGEVQEYPKHVTVGEGDDAVTVTVNSAEEEAQLTAPAAETE